MNLNRSAKIMIILAGAALLALLVLVVNLSRSGSQVKGLEVVIRYGDTPQLVDRQVVIDSVMSAIPDIERRQVKSVDCDRVASAAAAVPFLTHVSAAVSVSGKVVIRADQRRPIARLFYGLRELYLDDEGALFPVSTLGHCDVLVAGGDFTEPLTIDSLNAQLIALWEVASFLDRHDDYAALVDQIFVQSDDDIMMAPKVGAHVVELGDAADLDSKFDRLLTFYRRGMPRAGWDTYSLVSLKYKDQEVCRKKQK